MKKVLVTGANGFLGLRFCRILIDRGYQVRALVRCPEAASALPKAAEVRIVPDPWEENLLKSALVNIDTIVHLVSRAHIINDRAKNADELFYKVNVDLTRTLLNAATKTGVKQILYMSSTIAMGLVNDRILTEADACRPTTTYGQSKLAAEELVKKMSQPTGMQYTIVRPPLVYGPGVRANMLTIFKWVARGWPLPLGEINNRRSFIYIDNLVEASISALECPAAANQTFLVSDGEDVSTPELIRNIARALKSPCRLMPFPVFLLQLAGLVINPETINRLLGSLAVDSDKIKRVTGWVPRFALSDGLKITAEWYLKA